MLTSDKEQYTNSLGTQSLLDALGRFSPKNELYSWDTTIINAGTIVRNNLSKEKSDQEVLSGTLSDLSSLTTSIYHYFKDNQLGDIPYILFFIPNYNRLNPVFRRKLSPNEERITKLLTKLSLEIKDRKNGDKHMYFDMPMYFITAGNNVTLPYRHVFDKISLINGELKGIKKVMTRKYMLISHIALDYYLFRCFRNVKLFECFTGLVKEERDLGKKVFKEDGIPFNVYTHVLFGDSTKVKPLVSHNKKSKFVELAHRERWMLKQDTSIRSSIVMNDALFGPILSKVNF